MDKDITSPKIIPSTENRQMKTVREISWEEFRKSGFLWWINMLLHTFGMAIAVEIDENTGAVMRAYPARVRFRGFDEKSTEEGYLKISQYMEENAGQLLEEAK